MPERDVSWYQKARRTTTVPTNHLAPTRFMQSWDTTVQVYCTSSPTTRRQGAADQVLGDKDATTRENGGTGRTTTISLTCPSYREPSGPSRDLERMEGLIRFLVHFPAPALFFLLFLTVRPFPSGGVDRSERSRERREEPAKIPATRPKLID